MSEGQPAGTALRLGTPPTRRAAATIAVVTGFVTLVAAIAAGFGVQALAAGIYLGAVLVVLAATLAGLLWWLLLRALRFGTWLDGTTLLIRGAVGSTSHDLAAARDVTIEHELHGQLPQLVVRPPNGGRRIRVRLWTMDGRRPQSLPPAQLRALADAVAPGTPATATGCPEVGEGGSVAERVAAQLRALATPAASAGPCGMCGSSGSGCAFLERNETPNAQ